MKGQAFIVFRDISSATNAKHALDNIPFFGKVLRVNYSKSSSDIILKNSGQYTHKDKVKKDQERRKRREQEYLEIKAKNEKKVHTHINTKTDKTLPKQDNTQPSNTLFVEKLPADITESILKAVFSKYNGFKEVRHFSGKGFAFIEYDTEINAGGALLGLNGLKLVGDYALQISFAKK